MESVVRLLEKLLQPLELTHLQVRLICILIPNKGATGEKSAVVNSMLFNFLVMCNIIYGTEGKNVSLFKLPYPYLE